MKAVILPTVEDHVSANGHFNAKHVIMSLAIVLLSVCVFASELHITVWNNNPFIVELDGKRYNAEGEFIADHVSKGVHKIKVSQVEGNTHFTGNGSAGVLYMGNVRVADNAVMHAHYNEFGYLEMMINPLSGNDWSSDCDHPTHFENQLPQQSHYEQGTTGLHQLYSENTPAEVSDTEVDKMKRRLNDAWTDDERLSIANQALSKVTIKTAQVVALMEEFWFEKNRLAFAKAAYPHVSDPFSYYEVNEVFWFRDSANELEKFINGD